MTICTQMYTLSRKNGSFPETYRYTYSSYDQARRELRRYARKVVGGWGHAQHVPLAALSLFDISIKKEHKQLT